MHGALKASGQNQGEQLGLVADLACSHDENRDQECFHDSSLRGSYTRMLLDLRMLPLPAIRFRGRRIYFAGGIRRREVLKLDRVHAVPPIGLQARGVRRYRLSPSRELRSVCALGPIPV